MDILMKSLRKQWNMMCEGKSPKLKDRLENKQECSSLLYNLIKGHAVGTGDEKLPKINVSPDVKNKRLPLVSYGTPEYLELKNKYVQLYGKDWAEDGRREELEEIHHEACKKLFWKWYEERKALLRGEEQNITPEELETEAIKWATHLKFLKVKKMSADAHAPANGNLEKKRNLLAALAAYEEQPVEPGLIEWCKQKLADKYNLNIQNDSMSQH